MSYLPTTNLQPLKLAVKFNPPTIAVFYKYNQRDKKKRRYNIFLNQLAFLPTAQEITEKLFDEHYEFLNFVDFDQVYKMVSLILGNFTQQNQKINYINQIEEANSYIESQRESDKSVVFQNEEEVYYTSYEPNQLSSLKPLRLQEQLQRSYIADQPLQRSRFQNSLSPDDKQKISNFSSHMPSETNNTLSEKEMLTSSQGKNNKTNMSLSLSGMQQFMEQHHSNSKFPFQKSQLRGSTNINQKSTTNSPINMPTMSANQQSQDSGRFQPLQPLIGVRSDENNFNIANFVEEGNINNQMFIDDQLYESPVPQKKNNKFVQQQINQNQQYYLQQQTQNPRYGTSPQSSGDQKKKQKNSFLKQISDLRGDNFQDFLD